MASENEAIRVLHLDKPMIADANTVMFGDPHAEIEVADSVYALKPISANALDAIIEKLILTPTAGARTHRVPKVFGRPR